MTALLLRDVPHHIYHSDQVDEWQIDPEDEATGPGAPRLSRSVAVRLLNESPLHAWGAHPKLGGKPPADNTAASDAGSLLHGLLQGHGADVVVCMIPARDSKGLLREASPAFELEGALRASLVKTNEEFGLIPAANWLTEDAKRFRRTARAEGELPVLLHDLVQAEKVVPALREQLDYETEGAFSECEHELTALWEADGVACKARLDGLALKRALILDLKFVADAHPGAFGRSMRANGYDMQSAANREGVEAVHPELAGRVDWQPVCVEVDPRTRIPVQIGGKFVISLPRIGATMRDLGEQRWRRARSQWKRCLEENHWPGYDASAAIEARSFEQEDEMRYQLARAEEVEWIKGA